MAGTYVNVNRRPSSPANSDKEVANQALLTCVSSLGGRILLNTIAHPFEYAKFLIQVNPMLSIDGIFLFRFYNNV